RVRRVADPKGTQRLFAQATSGKVLACVCRLRAPQLIFKKLAGALVHLNQFSALVRVLGFLFRAVLHFGQLDVELFRNQPDGFDKADVLDLLHETEYVARSATTETMVELPRSVHRERRRLLLMEGAKPGEILRATLLQLDVIADHADDIRLL